MFLPMSINTENSEGFSLRGISIFKNTLGSHASHPLNCCCQRQHQYRWYLLFLHPTSPALALPYPERASGTGRACLPSAYRKGGQ